MSFSRCCSTVIKKMQWGQRKGGMAELLARFSFYLAGSKCVSMSGKKIFEAIGVNENENLRDGGLFI